MRYYFTVSENNLICISVPAAMHAYFRTTLLLRSFVALGGKRQDMNSINKLTLCIPMYNESSIIADTVKTLTAALEKYCEGGAYRRWELIVSDDGSTDGSADIVRSLGQSGVRICGYEHNRGKGCAVRTAMLEASREDVSPEHVIMFTDADLAKHWCVCSPKGRFTPYGSYSEQITMQKLVEYTKGIIDARYLPEQLCG